jgi:hypothetical protein
MVCFLLCVEALFKLMFGGFCELLCERDMLDVGLDPPYSERSERALKDRPLEE